MGKIKVTKYQGCSNIDIADALLNLSSSALLSCKEDKTLKELIISLAVIGWNISLYKDSDENYAKKIKNKMPDGFSDEYKKIFENFLMKLIKEKQDKYPELLKGITSHKIKIEDDKIDLVVHALPVKPI